MATYWVCVYKIYKHKAFYYYVIDVARQKPKSVLVLCEEELVVFDISTVDNLHCKIPFVLDLHKPAVTSMEYVNECPDSVISSLYSVRSKQLVKNTHLKVVLLNFYMCTYVLHVCRYACICGVCTCICMWCLCTYI